MAGDCFSSTNSVTGEHVWKFTSTLENEEKDRRNLKIINISPGTRRAREIMDVKNIRRCQQVYNIHGPAGTRILTSNNNVPLSSTSVLKLLLMHQIVSFLLKKNNCFFFSFKNYFSFFGVLKYFLMYLLKINLRLDTNNRNYIEIISLKK